MKSLMSDAACAMCWSDRASTISMSACGGIGEPGMTPPIIIRQLASPESFNYLTAERLTIGAEQHGWRP
jgi:hypothetical protein